jgi:hypothetical protein
MDGARVEPGAGWCALAHLYNIIWAVPCLRKGEAETRYKLGNKLLGCGHEGAKLPRGAVRLPEIRAETT